MEFPVSLPAGLTLNIDLFDSDMLTEDDFLGHTSLDLGQAEQMRRQEVHLTLDRGGVIQLETEWLSAGTCKEENTREQYVIISFYFGKLMGVKKEVESISIKVRGGVVGIDTRIVVREDDASEMVVDEGLVGILDRYKHDIGLVIVDNISEEVLGEVPLNIEDLEKLENLTFPLAPVQWGTHEEEWLELSYQMFYMSSPRKDSHHQSPLISSNSELRQRNRSSVTSRKCPRARPIGTKQGTLEGNSYPTIETLVSSLTYLHHDPPNPLSLHEGLDNLRHIDSPLSSDRKEE